MRQPYAGTVCRLPVMPRNLICWPLADLTFTAQEKATGIWDACPIFLWIAVPYGWRGKRNANHVGFYYTLPIHIRLIKQAVVLLEMGL